MHVHACNGVPVEGGGELMGAASVFPPCGFQGILRL